MQEVVRDQDALTFQGRSANEKIRIGQQLTSAIQLSVEGGGAVNDTIRQGQDETDLTQGLKGNLLGTSLLSFEPTQNLIARDDGEREPIMISQVQAHSLSHNRMLFQKFREDIGIEECEPLRH